MLDFKNEYSYRFIDNKKIMSYDHQIICVVGKNEERKITLCRAKLSLYDYSIKKIDGFYDDDVVDLFNYMINTYIVSTERISNWLKGEIDIDDFDYIDSEIKNHKILLRVLKLCNELKCDIGSDIISKLIAISILKTPPEKISNLVDFNDVE